MPSARRAIRYALIALLALALAGPALADAAPPLRPPGSNLAPGGETQVQMVAETVRIEVVPPDGVRIRADFTLRNQGTAEERMAVRFPLEEPSGMGDGYGRRAQVQNLAVAIGGQAVPWREIQEPFRDGNPPIRWAAFDVAFPSGQDVQLAVTYETALTGYGPGQGPASVLYILETGAGWYGPIGRADIIVHLPYPAGPDNVWSSAATASGAAYAGHQARWRWENLEPTRQHNFWVRLVWPEDWQRLLHARAALEARPADAQAALALAEACRTAGSDVKGFVAIAPLAGEAQSAIEQALAHAPGSADLHGELARVLVWRLPYGATLADPSLPRIRAELQAALALDPQNARALQAQRFLEGVLGPGAALEPSPTPDRAFKLATEEARTAQARPAATPSPAPSASPPPATATPVAAATGGGSTGRWLLPALVGTGVLACIGYVALRRRG